MSLVRVARVEEIGLGECRSVRSGTRRIAVWNVGGSFHAVEDACRHMKAPLSTGRLSGTTLTCAWHGWKYEVTTGECHDKAWGCLRKFPVTVEDGNVFVSDVEDPPPGGEGRPEEDEPADEFPTPVFRR